MSKDLRPGPDTSPARPAPAAAGAPGKQTLTAALPAASGTPAPAATSDEPVPGIDRPGFIDRDDGAYLRSGPLELGAPTVRDAPLPPGTRVFITGSHPRAPQWWYATAFIGKEVARGYVQRYRVATDLPEPLAELHQVVAGETVEKLARKKFSGAVSDGHDLRFYENVLLHVNRGRPDPAITGSYQAPNAFGGGANNIQLIAGKRLWLVSPEYAHGLESLVPSGSLTGGAVAKVRRLAGHLEDIVASITESRHHLDAVAGEYAQLIRDHMVLIVGTMAEGLSMFLAATPSGVGQALAAMIQLVLAALGVKNLVEVSLPALSHGNAWLLMAWTAKGDRAQITLASQELIRMLVQLALAVLTYRGIKSNLGNAARIAGAMPPGDAPALATAGATSGAGGAGAAAAAKLGPAPPLGAIGAGGAMMSRHDDEHGVSEPASQGGKPGKIEPTRGEPKVGESEPKVAAPQADEAAKLGRNLPEYPIAKSAIEAKINERPNAIIYDLEGRAVNGKTVQFGYVLLEMADGAPKAPPDMNLQADMFIAGVEHVPRIFEDVVIGAEGAPHGQGARISLTQLALERFGAFYERRFGTPLKKWAGSLAFENKLNFQREYAKLRLRGIKPEPAAHLAIERISFGKHRIAAGFTKFTVHATNHKRVDLGRDLGIQNVPVDIKATAEKP